MHIFNSAFTEITKNVKAMKRATLTHNPGAPLEVGQTCKKTHIMTRVFERVLSISHELWDVLHNVIVGYSLAGLWVWFGRFLNFDYDFLFWCAFFLGIDTFTGVYKHVRQRTASADGFSKFLDKVVIVVSTFLLLHGLENAELGQSIGELWFITGAHFTLYVWLGASILRNISQISGGKFPPQSWITTLDKILFRSEKPPKDTP